MSEEADRFDDGDLSIDDMLASGDPDLIEYANQLNAENATPDEQTPTPSESADTSDATQGGDELGQADDTAPPGETDSASTDDPSHASAPAPETGSESEPDTPDGVLTKDGKRVIPYEQLSEARQQAAQSKQQLNEMQSALADTKDKADKLQRQLDLATQRGIALPTLPEDETLSDKQIEELEDISPEMASVARQLQYLKGQVSEQQQAVDAHPAQVEPGATAPQDYTQDAIMTAFNNTPGMDALRQNTQHWEMAQLIEQQLANDPAYASLETRYAEVVKRVGGAFGVNLTGSSTPAPAPKKTATAPTQQPSLPESISDLPNGDDSATKSDVDIYASKSEEALHEELENLSPDQIEALLSGL